MLIIIKSHILRRIYIFLLLSLIDFPVLFSQTTDFRASLKTQDFCSDSRRKKFLNRSLPIVNEDLKISDNAEGGQKDKFLEVAFIIDTKIQYGAILPHRTFMRHLLTGHAAYTMISLSK